ncbi:hydroxymethylbilane synthase [Rosistilla oblonga]|uniref:hydroxymethylbilane synthase n=1 Tax=Rosistilla oblonga TaxID=2527990 RepID=UPI003A9813C1
MTSETPRTIRLATRQSPLALWQANWVSDRLTEAGHQVELILLTTRGDVDQRPIDGASAVGMFTKGIQRSVLAEESDVAIHSLKDLPTAPTPGLTLIATPSRAPVRDCLISRGDKKLDELAAGAIVGTGSRRREAQLRHLRPDLEVRSIRGNVETRLEKLDSGEYDAILLAEAGLQRLEMHTRITEALPPEKMLPAPGQGSLGIEIRTDDGFCCTALSALNDPDTHASVTAERTLMLTLEGGCLAPIGTYGRIVSGQLHLDAVVVSRDGKQRLYTHGVAPPEEAMTLARQLAEELLQQGAAAIIQEQRDE